MRKRGLHIFINTGLREKLEELELAECPETEECVIEGKYFLDSDLTARWLVKRGSYSAVCALADGV